ncbi:MAG: UTP--glucose-1-phosphate uridylyltransferase GalU [Desulfobacterales bacterium]
MRIRKAVLPVAGLGTRFLPATKVIPKEMLPVVDKPLIQYAVEEAIKSGIEQIIFVTGKRKAAIEDHFDFDFELEHLLQSSKKNEILTEIKTLVPETGTIVYTRQNKPLGLGHAIWCARDVVGEEPFAVILADDLIKAEKPVLAQMIEVFEQQNASIVAVMEVDSQDTDKYGIIDSEMMESGVSRVKGLVEKPRPVDAPSNMAIIGRYILTPEIFKFLGRKKFGTGGEIQLTDAMEMLLQHQSIFGYCFDGHRFDCGDKAGFQKANLAYAMERKDIRNELIPFLKEMIDFCG